jgi:fused signal recognition particle receptor
MFGFLKNKLKEWVEKAKDTLKPTEEPIEEKEEIKSPEEKEVIEKKQTQEKDTVKKQKKSSKAEKEEIKEPPKKKEKKQEVMFESPVIQEKEAGTAIEIEKELEEGVPEEVIDQELEKKLEPERKEEHKPTFSEKIKSFFVKKEPTKEEDIPEEKIKPKEELIIEGPITEETKSIKEKPVKKKKEPIKEAEEKSIKEEKIEEKQTFFSKLKSRFIYKITENDFNNLFDDLEMLLLENNVALLVVEDMKDILKEKLIGKEIKKESLESEIKKELKEALNEMLIDPIDPLDLIKLKKEKPFVMLFFGINGTGKTTSIAKIANSLKTKHHTVVLAAGDTFRAASIEQISEHAKKLNVPLIKHDYGSDPAAVGFDAIKYAKSHGIDVVLIDTAGRMHTKTNLISEMEKIVRVTKPDLKLFVAESIAGNDATEQASTFHEAINIDGSILSKADIDEKGGTIISISHITKRPIFYLGTGQKYEDLKLFNKNEYIKSLGLD